MALRDWKIHHSGFSNIDKLFDSPAFGLKDWETLFVAAMREAFDWHYEHNEVFRGHADLAGFSGDSICTLKDVENIPWIFVQNFKEAELMSVPKSEIVVTLTSSGTRGTKTQLFMDEASLNRVEVGAYNVYRDLGVLKSQEPCNYLLFTYDIEHASHLGTAWTDVMIADMIPGGDRAFLIRKKGEDFEFDLDYAIESYQRFAKSGKPLRILGFPAFMYHTFLEAEKRGLGPIPQAAGSWILTGGGWKNHQGEVIPKKTFAEFVNRVTGIPQNQVRDLFGMAEHGVGYVDCEAGELHVPSYAHAVTRDIQTLKANPEGTPGLLHLFSPLQKGYPSISLLTTDKAIIHKGICACGREGRRLEYVGRVGLKHYEGCALRALEYLK